MYVINVNLHDKYNILVMMMITMMNWVMMMLMMMVIIIAVIIVGVIIEGYWGTMERGLQLHPQRSLQLFRHLLKHGAENAAPKARSGFQGLGSRV